MRPKKLRNLIYFLLIILLLIRLTERNDEMNEKIVLKQEYLLLTKIRNLVHLISNYDLMFGNESFLDLERLKKLNQDLYLELKLALHKLNLNKRKFFDHKFRKILRLINLFIDELSINESDLEQNDGLYEKVKFYLTNICNFIIKLNDLIGKLENLSDKLDKFQILIDEFKLLTCKTDKSDQTKHSIIKSHKFLIISKFSNQIKQILTKINNQLTNGYFYLRFKYREFIDHICLITQDFWTILIDKFNEFLSFNKLIG